MKIEIELNDQIIRDVVSETARLAFQNDGYLKGYGTKVVVDEVARQVAAIDFRPIIAAECKRVAESRVAEVTAEAIKAAAKKTIKQMTASGELFAGVEGGGK